MAAAHYAMSSCVIMTTPTARMLANLTKLKHNVEVAGVRVVWASAMHTALSPTLC